MSHTVGAVARMSGVTVRTLHHYDEIGLLRPSGRSDNGYRRYADGDLERLQRILFYRELGFGLDDIGKVMTDGDADAVGHLRRQHAMLLDRIGRMERMVAAVEKAMEADTMGISLTPEERLEVFGDHDPDQYAGEAEERWGKTDAFRESQRRVSKYTKADWLRLKSEAEAYRGRLVEAMRTGSRPTRARRWTPQRSIGSTSAAGSTTAATRSTSGSGRCTSTIRASGPRTRRSLPGSPRT